MNDLADFPPDDRVIRFAGDPRPDLLADSAAWGELLSLTYDATDGDAQVFGSLHGLRCCGAGLQRDEGRWRIVSGAMDPTEYAADRATWLLPHAREVAELLRRLVLRTPSAAPRRR